MFARIAPRAAPRPARPREVRVVREADPELDAYNAAFDELELDWHWDRAILAELAAITSEKERIVAYLRRHRPHLLQVYDAGALAEHIAQTKARLIAR
jgi:hypothetical protein